MTQLMYGERLKYLREQRGMSQEDLAESLKFESRQIVSNIETGVRKLSGEELVACTEIFDVKLDYFTNSYILAGQGTFSWRQSSVAAQDLYDFETTAGEWIGAYRVLSGKLKLKPRALLAELRLTRHSSYEEAVEAGESVAAELELGDVPASVLIAAAEERLDTIVLMAEPQMGISGAACRLPEMNAIIINRQEPLSRRSFNLAHEIFHILTWEAMPPDYLDGVNKSKSRVEQLADKFASGLLLPSIVLEKYLEDLDYSHDNFVERVNEVATELKVSSQALLWRLVDLKKLNRDICEELTKTDWFTYNGGLLKNETPPLFSRKYLELISTALQKGLVSERRVSSLLNLSFEEMEALYGHYQLESPFGL
jgi:Zn-dependent peptidase ImmA (M78 family)/transcriptional regulator with XRE-family HTH domain